MIIIRSSADLERTFDGLLELELRHLLALRRDQLIACGDGDLGDYAHFIIVRPNDTLTDLEREVGFPLTGAAAPFEWVERGPGGWIEAPIMVSDDFSVVILANDRIATAPSLLRALRARI